ncbi:hypothetical protein YB2330_000878 [Saitoella coloradoensis]
MFSTNPTPVQTHRRQQSASAHRRNRSTAVARQTTSALPRVPEIDLNALIPDAAGVKEWTKNEKYCVSGLGRFPHVYGAQDANLQMFGHIDAGKKHGLITTATDAYVWSYLPSLSTTPTLTFSVPHRASTEYDSEMPLPLASLVSANAGSDEPGLVLIKPEGRVCYWDSIGGAIAEGAVSKRGVEGQITMGTNELCTIICSVEPAGFVVSTSHGRLVHLSLRDSMGRPYIGLTEMSAARGLWNSWITSIDAGGKRRDTCAVRAGETRGREERDVLVCTERGVVSRWVVSRLGKCQLVVENDFRKVALEVLRVTLPAAASSTLTNALSFVDVAAVPGSSSILILASYPSSGATTTYILFSAVLDSSDRSITSTYVLSKYSASTTTPPRLYLPSPAKTVFIVFQRAISVISIPSQDGGAVFEDVIDFKEDRNIEIVASGAEDAQVEGSRRLRNAGVVVAARGAGVLRCEVFEDRVSLEALNSEKLAKSKLEQAVFYGFMPDNPLDFTGPASLNFRPQEVASAAAAVSEEILAGTSKYFPTQLASLDDQMVLKAKLLAGLAEHLHNNFAPMDSSKRWKLCWDAEKCEGARRIWSERSSRAQSTGRTTRSSSAQVAVLENVMENITGQRGGDDMIRKWFHRNLKDMGQVVAQAGTRCTDIAVENKHDTFAIAKAVLEANDIILSALGAARQIRQERVMKYGLGDLKSIYENSLRPWTSTPDILNSLQLQFTLTEHQLQGLKRPSRTDDRKQKTGIYEEMIKQLDALVDLLCFAFSENVQWERKSGNKNVAEGCNKQYLDKRGSWILSLVKHGLHEKAYTIAERYEDYRTLVEICLEHQEAGEETQERVMNRLKWYLGRYHEDFAFVLYRYYVEKGQIKTLLTSFPEHVNMLSQFLDNEKYDRISWMHDVNLGNFNSASARLHRFATTNEDVLRNKKIELSLSKLALLVDARAGVTMPPIQADMIRVVDEECDVAEIQAQRRKEILPFSKNAIDQDAAVELAFADIGKDLHGVNRELVKGALREIIKDAVLKPEDLIDYLTLKNTQKNPAVGQDQPVITEFYQALQVLRTANLPSGRYELAERTIWRRMFLHDDWGVILQTGDKTDDEVRASTRSTALWQTLRSGLINGQFKAGAAIQLMPPNEAYFSSTPEVVEARFPNVSETAIEDWKKSVLNETGNLDAYIKQCNLSQWYEGILYDARDYVNKERNGTNIPDVEVDEEGYVHVGYPVRSEGEDVEMSG